MNARHRPLLFHASLSFGLALVTALVIWAVSGRSGSWLLLLTAWLVGLNLASFLWYGLDKQQAERNGGRVPELVLHALACAGGSPGAYLGMRVFRHKTIKGRFRAVFWLIVFVQVSLILWLGYVQLTQWFNPPSAEG